jgi:hypothetical protein
LSVRRHHLLALLPVAALLSAPFVADRPGRILGLPVLLAWTVGAVLVSAAVMALIHRLDRDVPDEDDS